MTGLDFVDTHIHLHDMRLRGLRYEWLEPAAEDEDLGDYGAIKAERYWADDLIGETRFQAVTKFVHVQHAVGSEDPLEETRWIQDFADRLGTPSGLIARVVLDQDEVAAEVARHAGCACFRGIRDQRYDDYLRSEAWRRGYGELAASREGLVFCDDPFVEQMADAAALAERHPQLTYCVDHAGYPRERSAEYFKRWREGMRRLAAVENTVVKISGLGMCDHRWTLESLRPWVMECIEAWGPDRVVFGSNWPLDRLFSSYGDLLAAYSELIAELSPAEQRNLFSANAERIFKLGH